MPVKLVTSIGNGKAGLQAYATLGLVVVPVPVSSGFRRGFRPPRSPGILRRLERRRVGFGAKAGIRCSIVQVEMREVDVEEVLVMALRPSMGMVATLQIRPAEMEMQLTTSTLVHLEEFAEDQRRRRRDREARLLGLT